MSNLKEMAHLSAFAGTWKTKRKITLGIAPAQFYFFFNS
jgi:hypothetical protein